MFKESYDDQKIIRFFSLRFNLNTRHAKARAEALLYSVIICYYLLSLLAIEKSKGCFGAKQKGG
jgi:hypothetical protein